MSDLISREAVYMANEHLKPCSPKDVEDMISCIPSAQRWIPCSERLPDKSNFYICTKKNRLVKTVWYSVLDGAWEENVIAWMPLPKPYGGE